MAGSNPKGNLKPGSFYWVMPIFDVDLVPPGFEGKEYSADMHEAMESHWSNREQPALFVGYAGSDELGWDERFILLGVEESDDCWGVRWVGKEIER